MTASRPVTVALADVNLLLALAWPDHHTHAAATKWFQRQRSQGWATTPVTQSGFVRISSNRTAVPSATTPEAALANLAAWTAMDGHEFWPDDVDGVVTSAIDMTAVRGYRQVTDAHLISLAERHGGLLATFDTTLSGMLAKGSGHLVEVVA